MVYGLLVEAPDSFCIEPVVNAHGSDCFLTYLLYCLCHRVMWGHPFDVYYCFLSLEMCLKRISQLLAVPHHLPVLSSLLRHEQSVKNVIHTKWDSPCCGVPDLCAAIFRHWLRIRSALEHQAIDFETITLFYLTAYPWFVRGKFRLLAVLFEECPPKTLFRLESNIMSHLQKAVAPIHMASLSASLWKIIITRLSIENEADCALERYIRFMVRLLHDSDRITASNVSRYWLPLVAKICPKSLYAYVPYSPSDLIKSDSSCFTWQDVNWLNLCSFDVRPCNEAKVGHNISNEQTRIWASVVLLKAAVIGSRSFEAFDVETLRCILFYPSDDVRIEAFELLCSLKKTYNGPEVEEACTSMDRYFLKCEEYQAEFETELFSGSVLEQEIKEWVAYKSSI
ncbi:unnamed protein product [Soboliphyme baturini]|uniref:Rapamycin-insensitive companion of mTOR n=1 Tax=Soboliphyme baturini TaxID=241478 RepID=A0A183J669_9BILA|nr:unnamed protein product [Soboliphyme baturini]